MKKILFSIIAVVGIMLLKNVNTNGNEIQKEKVLDICTNEQQIIIPEQPKMSEPRKEIKRMTVEEIAKAAIERKLEERESVDDLELWFTEYKNISERFSDVLDMPESIYDRFTEEELDFLFRVVQAEIGEQYNFDQKCNVASVIFNRLDNEKFGDGDLLKVLVPSQFYTIKSGAYKKSDVSKRTILACEYSYVFPAVDYDVLFFDSNNALGSYYKMVMNDGAHNFYKYNTKNGSESN